MRRRDHRDLEEEGREKEVEITDSIALFHLHVPATLLTRSLQGVQCCSHVILYIAAIFMQSFCCSEVLNSAASMYMNFYVCFVFLLCILFYFSLRMCVCAGV